MITREFLKTLQFKPFCRSMWFAFAGCESPIPFYAETDNLLVILDGQICHVLDENGDDVDFCENICDLPYPKFREQFA